MISKYFVYLFHTRFVQNSVIVCFFPKYFYLKSGIDSRFRVYISKVLLMLDFVYVNVIENKICLN